MTTIQMLASLIESNNEVCSKKAIDILSGKITIEDELKYSGSFMKSVLKGDFQTALLCADQENIIALKNAIPVIGYEEGFAKTQEEVNFLIFKSETDKSFDIQKQIETVNKKLDEVCDNFDFDNCSIERVKILKKYYEILRNNKEYEKWLLSKDV